MEGAANSQVAMKIERMQKHLGGIQRVLGKLRRRTERSRGRFDRSGQIAVLQAQEKKLSAKIAHAQLMSDATMVAMGAQMPRKVDSAAVVA